MTEPLSTAEAARRVGVSPGTLRRWAQAGVLPQAADGWDEAALGQARLVARLRSRGHTLREIAQATGEGRLAFGSIEHLLQTPEGDYSIEDAARETGLDPALIQRLHTAMGYNAAALERLSEDDLQLLRYVAAVLAAGLPLVALLQLARVYGQALAQIADAEVRLFHLYVHEPLMRDGVPGIEMAEEMRGLSGELLPLASPIMEHIHRRFMAYFVEQDVVGHMEADAGEVLDLGRVRVAIAFADLAGYTRLTEEVGEEEAVGAVERFVELVELTLPEDARVIKTIGDEVMVVGGDASSLVDWAVGFQQLNTERPAAADRVALGPDDLPRRRLLRPRGQPGPPRGGARGRRRGRRDAARRRGVAGRHLEFERIGEVSLKGFTEPTELFLARPADEG